LRRGQINMSAFKYNRLDKNNVAVLLVDHQSGLTNLVQDFSPDDFKNNVLALADAAKYFKLPTILTTSFEDGPNGPLVPELKALFPDAPYIARPGNINAWDNEDFVKAVKATGKKQLLIAGIVTEVCVAFPALSAGRKATKCSSSPMPPARSTRPPAMRPGRAWNGGLPVHDVVRRGLRTAPRLAQRHRRAGRAVLESPAELPLPDHQLLLVMDGEPIFEPVVGHGPFVMNSRAQIQQAFEEYQLGKMGELG
jgi:nicotinamidase-related amidase